MPLTFPSSPSVNQTYTSSGRTWQWNGATWKVVTNDNASITAGSITETSIADSAVTTAKIANSAVTSSKLESGAAASNLGFTPASTGKSIAMSIVFGG